MIEKYKLKYLPLFWEDLRDISFYISNVLHAPIAANAFLDEVEDGILNHLKNPKAATVFPSYKERQDTYYWFPVKNYRVFYVVIDNVMEVRRCLYGKRNIESQLDI